MQQSNSSPVSHMTQVGLFNIEKYKSDIRHIAKTETLNKVLKNIADIAQQANPRNEKLKCFISYAWGNKQQEDWVKWLAERLECGGFHVWLDVWHNKYGCDLATFVEKITPDNTDFVVAVGTPAYLTKYNRKATDKNAKEAVVRLEARLLNYEIMFSEEQSDYIVPILLEGEAKMALPPLMRPKLFRDFTPEEHFDFEGVLDLAVHLYSIDIQKTLKLEPRSDSFKAINNQFEEIKNDFKATLKSIETKTTQKLTEQYQAKISKKLQGKSDAIDNNVDKLLEDLLVDDEDDQASNINNNSLNTKATSSSVKKRLTPNSIFTSHNHPEQSVTSADFAWNAHHRETILPTQALYASNVPLNAMHFQPRQAYQELVQRFASMSQPVTMVAITGVAGSGKSELAKYYAHEYTKKISALQNPPVIAWLNAETSDTLKASYLDLAANIGIPATDKALLENDTAWAHFVQRLNQALVLRPGWLLVFDNVVDYSNIKPYLKFAGNTKGQVLVTTQQTHFFKSAGQSLTLNQGMGLTEAAQLLCTLSGLNDIPGAEHLATTLDGLPLALSTAALMIKQTNEENPYARMTFARYEQQLSLTLQTLEQQNASARDQEGYVATQVAAVQLALKKLEDTLALDLLQLCSLIQPEHIPLSLLESYLKICLPGLADLDIQSEVAKALQLAQSYSLLTKEQISDELNLPLFAIHRTTQSILRERSGQRDDTWLSLLERSLRAFEPLLPPHERSECGMTTLQSCKSLRLHLEALIDQPLIADIQEDVLAVAYLQLGSIYLELGPPKKALYCFEASLAICQSLYSEQHLGVVSSLINIGAAYAALGQLKEELDYLQKALVIQRHCYGEQHPEVASSLDGIGMVYRALGQHEEALDYMQKALAIRQCCYGEQHPDVASSLRHIGIAYRELEQPEEALDYMQKALAIQQCCYGEQHPDVASSLCGIGATYAAFRQPKKALNYAQKALVIQQHCYGQQHPDVAQSLHYIGIAYRALGQSKEGLDSLQKALAIRQHCYGVQHPDVAASLNEIGISYQFLGKMEDAKKSYQASFQIYQATLGEQHPDTKQTKANLETLGELEELEEQNRPSCSLM